MKRNLYILLLLLLPLFFSCGSARKAIYFGNIPDSTIQLDVQMPQSLIRNNDILSINISSLNPEASQIFNYPGNSATASSGYLVNQDGYIQLPVLGNFKAAGYTKDQLENLIIKELADKKLLKDPVVIIRNQNFHISVLGEVVKPSLYSIPSEQVTILEALSMAGDLTIYGRRNNILLVRDENGVRMMRRLNLNSDKILSSPYYFLKSNDVIYVEPGKAKLASINPSRQLLPLIISGLSVVAVIFRLVK